MNIQIKNKILIAALLTFIALSNAYSQTMDSSFTYQGELIDNGVPANGQYDINLDLIDGDLQSWGNTSVHSPVNVVNGVFSVNADFDISYFNGYKDFTVTISVRKTSEGPGGAFTTLGSQTVQAVPMATNLTNGSATTGQVLTFNGFQWAPQTPSAGGASQWTEDSSSLVTQKDVGIGTIVSPDANLHIETSNDVPAIFDGGDDMYIWFLENGEGRGYIGSFQTAGGGILDEDFEIGTTNGSIGNMHIVTGNNQPRITATASGKIGINNTNPLADLHIEAETDGDVMRVIVAGTTKFYLDDNGGTGVGAWTTPPTNGLRVQGDVKQPTSSNGMMKYMVHVKCKGSTSSITKSYNGVNSSAITLNNRTGSGVCDVAFPVDITGRYYQVSAISANKITASCTFNISDEKSLICFRHTSDTGIANNGDIMILVY